MIIAPGPFPQASRLTHTLIPPLAILILLCAACQPMGEDSVRLPADHRARTSYSIGLKIGSGLAAQPLDLHLDWVERGIRDAIAGRGVLSTSQADAEIQAAQSIVRAGDANAAAGEKLRSQNHGNPKVTELDSGVQYRVVSAGTGAPPQLAQVATLQYRVTTAGGRAVLDLFESGQTETVRVGDLISGLTEALVLMPPRSRWVVTIPPDRAYGERGRPPFVGPSVTLVFDILLVRIEGSDSR